MRLTAAAARRAELHGIGMYALAAWDILIAHVEPCGIVAMNSLSICRRGEWHSHKRAIDALRVLAKQDGKLDDDGTVIEPPKLGNRPAAIIHDERVELMYLCGYSAKVYPIQNAWHLHSRIEALRAMPPCEPVAAALAEHAALAADRYPECWPDGIDGQFVPPPKKTKGNSKAAELIEEDAETPDDPQPGEDVGDPVNRRPSKPRPVIVNDPDDAKGNGDTLVGLWREQLPSYPTPLPAQIPVIQPALAAAWMRLPSRHAWREYFKAISVLNVDGRLVAGKGKASVSLPVRLSADIVDPVVVDAVRDAWTLRKRAVKYVQDGRPKDGPRIVPLAYTGLGSSSLG